MNKKAIIAQMTAIVNEAEELEYYTSMDDVEMVQRMDETDFPIIWQVGYRNCVSRIFKLSRTVNDFKKQGHSYWSCLRGSYPYEFLWNESNAYEIYYLIDQDGVHRVADVDALRKAVESVFNPLIAEVKAANGGVLPYDKPIDFEVTNLSKKDLEIIKKIGYEHEDDSFEEAIRKMTERRYFKNHRYVAEYNHDTVSFLIREYDGNTRVNSDPFVLVFYGWPENGVREDGRSYGWDIENL